MERSGPVQSMSVVDFRGIDIKGDCCAMMTGLYRHVYVYLDRRYSSTGLVVCIR